MHALNALSSALQAGLLPVPAGSHTNLTLPLTFIVFPFWILNNILFWLLSHNQLPEFTIFRMHTLLVEDPSSAPV